MSRGIALLFLGPRHFRWGWGSAPRPCRLHPRERPGTHCTGGWVGCTSGLDRCGKSRPRTGIRSPDRPARSQSLYRLSYPGPPLPLYTSACLDAVGLRFTLQIISVFKMSRFASRCRNSEKQLHEFTTPPPPRAAVIYLFVLRSTSSG